MPGAEGGEVVRFTLLSLPSRNSSNKCTFHTKVSLFVLLLSLDPPLVDCKFKVCVIPKPFCCKCPAVKMASNWVPVCSVCGGSPCAFTYCQTFKHLFLSLWLSWGLRFFRERESESARVWTSWWHSGFTPTPQTGSMHIVVSCEWLVHCWCCWRQGSSLICVTLAFRRSLCRGRDSWQTWSIKNKAVPYNLPSHTQDPCSQNSICSSCREQTALSLHSTLGEGRIYG